jgi:hypothetical protein
VHHSGWFQPQFTQPSKNLRSNSVITDGNDEGMRDEGTPHDLMGRNHSNTKLRRASRLIVDPSSNDPAGG